MVVCHKRRNKNIQRTNSQGKSETKFGFSIKRRRLAGLAPPKSVKNGYLREQIVFFEPYLRRGEPAHGRLAERLPGLRGANGGLRKHVKRSPDFARTVLGREYPFFADTHFRKHRFEIR